MRGLCCLCPMFLFIQTMKIVFPLVLQNTTGFVRAVETSCITIAFCGWAFAANGHRCVEL